MKKIDLYIYMVIGVLLFPFVCLQAQHVTPNEIILDGVTVKKEGNNVVMNVTINLDNLDLSSQQMVVLTPEVRSGNGLISHRFQPLVITGAIRNKALERAIDFNNFTFEQTPVQIIRRHNKRSQSIPLTLYLPYEKWMSDAGFFINEDMLGCACDSIMKHESNIKSPLLFEPVYQFSYITPPVESVKQRDETYAARLNFELAKYNLLRDFKNNAEVLKEVDTIINEIRNDSNLTVTNFTITGYASPEGNEQSNMKLSENRAFAFVDYLKDKYEINPSDIETTWKGEDWEELRRVVEASVIADKNAVLAALDEPDNFQRKSKLKMISGGDTYRMLLREYYPPLRRNEYTVSYVARPFSLDEAKQLIYTKPQHLSLNEMFLVANTYPAGSSDFKEVFYIASHLYPDNPVAQLNTATLELENGHIDLAIERLSKIDMSQAWNNLGIAYALKGDYRQAGDYFRRAVESGDQTASHNLSQLAKLVAGY